jgi:hypothetical protein
MTHQECLYESLRENRLEFPAQDAMEASQSSVLVWPGLHPEQVAVTNPTGDVLSTDCVARRRFEVAFLQKGGEEFVAAGLAAHRCAAGISYLELVKTNGSSSLLVSSELGGGSPGSLRELGSSLGRGPAAILAGTAAGMFPETRFPRHEGSTVAAGSCSTVVEHKKGVRQCSIAFGSR